MITAHSQRWRDRRAIYRPAGEIIVPSEYEVDAIPGDDVARAFVVRMHYSASYPAARRRFGLYRHGVLVGVAVFSEPVNARTLLRLPGSDPKEKVELGRLVLLNEVPDNGESFFVARCFHQLVREGFSGVVSFSDPVPRTDATGGTIFGGHVGTVYKALSAVYTGRTNTDTLRLLPDGHVFPKRAMQKIRKREQGWRYAAAVLEKLGAEPQDARAWLTATLARYTRTLRHRGNHTYLFGLSKATKRHLPASLPYPTFLPTALANTVASAVTT